MKKTVLTYGLISGAIAVALMLAHVPFMDGSSTALAVGYLGALREPVRERRLHIPGTVPGWTPGGADLRRHSSASISPDRPNSLWR
jgi:hypothetical protein